jgi:ElaB/YqjD/DUF883 family membrane-anchored ribosome-binding protein
MATNPSSQGNFKDKAENTGANLGATAGRKVGEAASAAGQKAQETAANIGQRAQEMASNVAQRAQDAASTVASKTGDVVSSVGDRMSSLAGTIREKGPQGGMIGSAATGVADQLQAGGQYLQQHDLRDITEDLTAVIRRYPMQSILVALGAGFLAGMASRR